MTTAAFETLRTVDAIRPVTLAAVLLVSGAAWNPTAGAQVVFEEAEVIHWAYGAFLGTGWYQLDENREVFVLRAPLAWTLRQADEEAQGWDRAGVVLEAPVSIGLHSFGEFDDFIDTDNVGTLAVTPGIQVDWPWNERLLLRGFAHVGYGGASAGDESAWIWDVGVRSRYGLVAGRLDWAWVNEVFHVGYNPRNAPTGTLGGLMTGLEFARPLRGSAQSLEWRWDLSWRWLGNPLTFVNQDRTRISIDDEWQISASIGRVERPFRIGFIEFGQVGLSYRFSSDGEFRAITLVFAPLFDR